MIRDNNLEGRHRVSDNSSNTNGMSNTYKNIPLNNNNVDVEKNGRFIVFKTKVTKSILMNL